MKIYEVIDHPADLKLKVFGKDLPELFCNLVRAVAREVGGEKLEVRDEKWENVEIESSDLFSLLVDFASEIVYRSDVNNKVYFDCRVEKVEGPIAVRSHLNRSLEKKSVKIRAKIIGVALERKLDIKAATYHEGYVKKVDDHWEAVILFDI